MNAIGTQRLTKGRGFVIKCNKVTVLRTLNYSYQERRGGKKVTVYKNSKLLARGSILVRKVTVLM